MDRKKILHIGESVVEATKQLLSELGYRKRLQQLMFLGPGLSLSSLALLSGR